MLNVVNTKADVVELLYHLGEGRGLPPKAVEYLEPFIAFKMRPSGLTNTFSMHVEGELAVYEEEECMEPAMDLDHPDWGGHYLPKEDDFEMKVDLPAAVYSYFEDSFDRMGDFTAAFIDFVPLDKLEPPKRYYVGQLFLQHLNYGVGTYPRNAINKLEGLVLDDKTVTDLLSKHYNKDLDSETLDRSFAADRFFSLFHCYLDGRPWSEVTRMEAIKRD